MPQTPRNETHDVENEDRQQHCSGLISTMTEDVADYVTNDDVARTLNVSPSTERNSHRDFNKHSCLIDIRF